MMKEFIVDFLLAETEQEVKITMKKMNQLMKSSSPEIKEILHGIISAKVKLMTKEIQKAIEEADNLIATPEFTIDLNEWITMKEYTKRFQLSSTNVVSNWIKRGLVPPSNIRILPMLNNLKLIKAIKYL